MGTRNSSRGTVIRCRTLVMSLCPELTVVDEYGGTRECSCGCGNKAVITILYPLFKGEPLSAGEARMRLYSDRGCITSSIEKIQKRLGELF